MANSDLANMLCLDNMFIMACDDGFIRMIGKTPEKKYGIISEMFIPRDSTQKKELIITAFAKLKNYFLIGNSFGEIWIFDSEEVMSVLKRSPEFTQNGVYLTQESSTSDQIRNDVDRCLKCVIRGVHDDKILKIEVINDENAFITTSYDCQTILWVMRTDFEECKNIKRPEFYNRFLYFANQEIEKIGVFRTSKDNVWKFPLKNHIHETNKIKEVNALLKHLDENKSSKEIKDINTKLTNDDILKKATLDLKIFQDSIKRNQKM